MVSGSFLPFHINFPHNCHTPKELAAWYLWNFSRTMPALSQKLLITYPYACLSSGHSDLKTKQNKTNPYRPPEFCAPNGLVLTQKISSFVILLLFSLFAPEISYPYFPVFLFLVCWQHTGICSGITPDSAPRNTGIIQAVLDGPMGFQGWYPGKPL